MFSVLRVRRERQGAESPALPDHAAHAVFRFKRLGFQKRECLCLCAARQENSDRGGDQNDQYAEANTSRCIFRDVGGIFAQSAEQDQRNG